MITADMHHRIEREATEQLEKMLADNEQTQHTHHEATTTPDSAPATENQADSTSDDSHPGAESPPAAATL